MAKTAVALVQIPPSIGDGTLHPQYTCPAGRKAYITHIHFANPAGTADSTCAVYLDNGVYSFAIVPSMTCDSRDVLDFYSQPGFIILAGTKIDVANASTTTVLIEGYEELV
jgi:hypothetical protein